MPHDLIVRGARSPALPGAPVSPAPAADAGGAAARCYVEFFAAQARAASEFFGWCEPHGLALAAVQPVHVAARVESLGARGRHPGRRRPLGRAEAPEAALPLAPGRFADSVYNRLAALLACFPAWS